MSRVLLQKKSLRAGEKTGGEDILDEWGFFGGGQELFLFFKFLWPHLQHMDSSWAQG